MRRRQIIRFGGGGLAAAPLPSLLAAGGSLAEKLYRCIPQHSHRVIVSCSLAATNPCAPHLSAELRCAAVQTSLVGSIGVISATFGATEAAKRLGIERRVFTAGEAKMQLDPFLPVQPEQVGPGGGSVCTGPATWRLRLGPGEGAHLAASCCNARRPSIIATRSTWQSYSPRHTAFWNFVLHLVDAFVFVPLLYRRRPGCGTSWKTCMKPSRKGCEAAEASAWQLERMTSCFLVSRVAGWCWCSGGGRTRRHAHTHTDGDLVPVPDVVQAAPGQAGRH